MPIREINSKFTSIEAKLEASFQTTKKCFSHKQSKNITFLSKFTLFSIFFFLFSSHLFLTKLREFKIFEITLVQYTFSALQLFSLHASSFILFLTIVLTGHQQFHQATPSMSTTLSKIFSFFQPKLSQLYRIIRPSTSEKY